jgi:glucose/arabinose dehydrogenase
MSSTVSRLVSFAMILGLLVGSIPFFVASAGAQVTTVGEEGAGVAQPGGTLAGDPQVQLVKVADGLIDPINVATANDGSGRVFVLERVGYVRIIDADGNLVEEPFLDIRNFVKIDFLEQGLLGLAFHPDYENNGKFYVYYSDYQTNGKMTLAEYTVSDDNPDEANSDSGRILFSLEDPYVNHNGGTIHFGPDGYLYITIGDGGLAGDPFDNAQDLSNLLGKILRIDVDVSGPGIPYGIPEDNPFVTGQLPTSQASQIAQTGDYHPDARPEIWAYGLRNAWQFSFDQATGDMYIADLGQVAWEEINYAPAGTPGGVNYGWDWMEGGHCYPPSLTECGLVGTLPVAEYSHAAGDCSITGLGVYRGEESANLDGIYFASDFCSGRIWGLQQGEDGAWQFQELLDTTLLSTGAGQDEAGELYMTACECEFGRDYDPFENPTGTVWKLVAADQVADGAETAPLEEGDASANAEPSEEREEVLAEEGDEGATPEATPEA